MREGFPDLSPAGFTDMLQDHYECEPDKICNRIEFKKLGGICEMCGGKYIVFLEHVCHMPHLMCRCVAIPVLDGEKP